MASRTQILRIYKQLLKESSKFSSFMYRTYSLRRIKDAFREHKEETDNEKIQDLVTYANSNLEIIKRQVVIGQLFRGPEIVIEKQLKSNKALKN
ncbi:LOW QUALITY PROTEIN: LYR motif-containing protein 4-like [Uloborus diversus]|uniref:LYR motif-containing protein 4-like n=1 Tax=Uloborus diversus TaxID=327109 RepID=UPI00240986CD|nr:LYR motif-containing protein 4-like [Uloborus diversus]XP_054721586.1 LOW QUALITY PROTEIN: LYR motif-containing protein 4-like [Uloborus diversus]